MIYAVGNTQTLHILPMFHKQYNHIHVKNNHYRVTCGHNSLPKIQRAFSHWMYWSTILAGGSTVWVHDQPAMLLYDDKGDLHWMNDFD